MKRTIQWMELTHVQESLSCDISMAKKTQPEEQDGFITSEEPSFYTLHKKSEKRIIPR